MTVPYADLDLAKPVGIAALERRIAQAVHTLSASAPTGALEEAENARHCRTSAMSSVRPQTALATVEARQRSASRKTGSEVAESQ